MRNSSVKKWEVILFLLVLMFATFTRFFDLGSRVMSHDESLHTYYSWELYKGKGYEHTPMMHGPLQFHMVALSYFIFGDSDFSARIPAVLCSILSVAMLWGYRRYLGSVGTILSGILFTISPFMLFYGRYVRNEAYVVLFGLLTIWAVLRYLEDGKERYLYLVTTVTALHFASKETAFFYTAQLLVFLGILFLSRISKSTWKNSGHKQTFMNMVLGSIVLVPVIYLVSRFASFGKIIPVEGEAAAQASAFGLPEILVIILSAAAVILFSIGLFLLFNSFGWINLREERSFDLLVLLFGLSLPHLSPIFVNALGFDPLDYTSNASIIVTGFTLIILFGIAFWMGLRWNARLWLINIGLFFGIFSVFFTTFFTNGEGFFTGLVGSLGYWLSQQGVERGSQPWYYYLLIQIPFYEYLTAFGSLLAAGFGIRWLMSKNQNENSLEPSAIHEFGVDPENLPEQSSINIRETPLALFGFWAVSSVMAYSFAGEKMPWITVHIALPMILLSAWAFGKVISRIRWKKIFKQEKIALLIMVSVFIINLVLLILDLWGNTPPFQGKEMIQLQATGNFILHFLLVLISGGYVIWKSLIINNHQIPEIALIFILISGSILTARTAFTAAYQNEDRGTEFLVYAHSARGVKDALNIIEDISDRMTDGLFVNVAFDNDVSWPMTWYLRNYPKQHYYADNPGTELRDSSVILVGNDNYDKINTIVKNDFYELEYVRMVWPNQDYFPGSLNSKIISQLKNADMRQALINIWFNRDYRLYGEITSLDITLPNWYPGDQMRLYIRKDIAQSLYDYNVLVSSDEVNNSFEGKQVYMTSTPLGLGDLELSAPRDIEIDANGNLLICDSRNNRITRILPEGTLLQIIGVDDAHPEKNLLEPWGIAVNKDGEIFVADTWNHRVVKFDGNGLFITSWGGFGQDGSPYSFWGPRDIAVDSDGRVYVSDTGNKRILVFSNGGDFIAQIGDEGSGPGQFEEPVGVSIDPNSGNVYVADTWNARVQIFSEKNGTFEYLSEFEVLGWESTSVDNKPFLKVDPISRVHVVVPEWQQVITFSSEGDVLYFIEEPSIIGYASSAFQTADGKVWVTDGLNNSIIQFSDH
ncbi:MAG: TIGR03663 family protein [Anaerolineales bacterium]|nr:TIGR03663 family protein [Anaerolineales bacterium]